MNKDILRDSMTKVQKVGYRPESSNSLRLKFAHFHRSGNAWSAFLLVHSNRKRDKWSATLNSKQNREIPFAKSHFSNPEKIENLTTKGQLINRTTSSSKPHGMRVWEKKSLSANTLP